MIKTLQISAVPPRKCREVPCTARLSNVVTALIAQLKADIKEMEREKADLERKLAVILVLKEMGL